MHSFVVAYFQNTDDAGILLTYSGTDTSNVEIVLQRPSAVSAPFNAWHFFLGGGGTPGKGGDLGLWATQRICMHPRQYISHEIQNCSCSIVD